MITHLVDLFLAVRSRGKEGAWRWLADRIPARLVTFVLFRAGAHAVSGRYSGADLTYLPCGLLLQRWMEDVDHDR